VLRKTVIAGLVIILQVGVSTSRLSAEVLLDSDPVETEFAFLLRDHAEEKGFYYIPKAPRIAQWPDGKPKFTLIQYARTGKDISGGLLHFLVTYGLTAEERDAVQQELQTIVEGGRVLGPVQFIEGEFNIISASAGIGGIFTRKVVGTGKAPLLAGQEAAVSIALTEEGSTLLMESFKKPTSDVSVQFLLTYQGLTPAYRAILSVDWDKVYTHKAFRAGFDFIFVSAAISTAFDELRETGAIALEVIGEDENMDALLQSAYSTLVTMMFEANPAKQAATAQPSSGRRSFLSKLFGIADVGYSMRKTKMTGHYTVDLTKRMRAGRQIPLTGNIGDIYRRYGRDPEIFGFVDLDDPAFEKRTIHLILDGEDYESFKEYINYAGVTLRRTHDSGNVTMFDKVLDRNAFAEDGNKISLEYLRKGDRARSWLEYEYRTLWSFRGGVELAGEFVKTDAAVLTLTPPYRYRAIQVLANSENMDQNDIVFLSVRFRHDYLGRVLTREVALREGEPLNVPYRYLSAPDDLEYEYQVTFFTRDGRKIEKDWQTGNSSFLYAY
jgi:hypothetical protein